MNPKELYHIEIISKKVVMIFCTTYINPISYLPTIEQDLNKLDFTGAVFFDLLLSNGYSFNRFAETLIYGGKIDRKSIRIIDSSELENIILLKANNFYKSHAYLVERNNILMEEEKYYLINA
jgi:hypothetical protein